MRLRALTVAAAMFAGLLVPAGAAQAVHGVCNGQHITIDNRDGSLTAIDGTSNDDVIAGGPAGETINGLGGDDHICGGGGVDTIDGGAGHDQMFGDAGDDTIIGGADPVDCEEHSTCGNDLLVGLAGDDTLAGGTGRDTSYYYDAPDPGVDGLGLLLNLAADNDQAITGNGTDQLESIEDVYGSPFNDEMTGDDANNYLDGDPGNDAVYGGHGNDIVIGDNPDFGTNPSYVAGTDYLNGGPGHDHHWGLGGNDTMEDPSGTNRFAGDQGDDIIKGGSGFDYVDYFCRAQDQFCKDQPADVSLGLSARPKLVTTGQNVDLKEGVAFPNDPGSVGDGDDANDHGTDTLENIEGVRGSEFDDGMWGRDNVQDQGPGDYFWPEDGDDYVDGRLGPDYVDYDVDADDPDQDCTNPVSDLPGLTLTLVPNEDPSIPEVTGYQGDDHLVFIEHAIGSPRRDEMTGANGNNELWGGCGDDIINGAGGGDYLSGDDQDDVLNAGSGDDKLVGGAGDDAMHGNAGARDLVSYDAPVRGPSGRFQTVRVDVHLGAGTAQSGIDEDAISTVEVVVGSPLNDVLVGGPSRDILIGGRGSDELWGRGGPDVLLGKGLKEAPGTPDVKDRLYGGTGTDTVDYSQAVGGVTVNLDAERGREGGGLDDVFGVEAVQGSDYADTLIGDDAANRLFGGKGDDTLDGGGANDYLDGQGGSDVIRGGGGPADVADFGYAPEANTRMSLQDGDAVVRNANTAPTNETLGGVEVVAGTRGQDVLRGTSRSDYLAGEGGDDALYGLGGDDFLFGQSGTDSFDGGGGTNVCHKSSRETANSCDRKPTGVPDWYARVTGPRQFRASGTDDFLTNLDAIIEKLRDDRRNYH